MRIKETVLMLLCGIAIENANAEQLECKWGNLPAGGGGYITGMVAHPTEKDLMYIRTDVGGVYAYEPKNSQHPNHPAWRQLMEWITVDQNSLWGTDGIAINPTNPDEIYVALGIGAGDSYINNDPYPQGVFKSSDRGQSWTQVLNKRFRGNQGNRSTGECIAVCPEGKGNVVLVGTRFEGLYRSTTSGESWKKVENTPTDSKGVGIRCVAFDPVHPENAWFTAYNSGVYYSTNKGESFSLLEGTASIKPREVAVGTDGVVWITSQSGVYKYEKGTLTKNSPSSLTTDYNGISIDRNNPNHIVISQQLSAFKTKIYRTTDGGNSWKDITKNKSFKNNVPWYRDEHMGAAIASVTISPFNSNELWFTDWYLPWKTDDVSQDVPYFESIPWGVEELVVFDIAAPPSEAILYNGCADNGGLKHVSMTEYPTVRFGEQESTGLDFCEAKPASIVRVSSNGWGQSGFRVSRSDDAGMTWRTVYSPKTTGKVAFSATDTKNYLYIPTGKSQTVLVTTDDGQTWENVSGLPQNTWNAEFWQNYNRALISDKVNGSVYYAYISGKIYRSDNKGVTFSVVSSSLPSASTSFQPHVYMMASPYAEGDIWISIAGKGLYHSTDKGVSFQKISNFSSCRTVAVGPSLTDGGVPTVYSYACDEYDGWGAYYSDDNGENWYMMTNESWQASNNPRQLAADRNCPGRIFIGTGGRGIYCGELVNVPASIQSIKDTEKPEVSYDKGSHKLMLRNCNKIKNFKVVSKDGRLLGGGSVNNDSVKVDIHADDHDLLIISFDYKNNVRDSIKIGM